MSPTLSPFHARFRLPNCRRSFRTRTTAGFGGAGIGWRVCQSGEADIAFRLGHLANLARSFIDFKAPDVVQRLTVRPRRLHCNAPDFPVIADLGYRVGKPRFADIGEVSFHESDDFDHVHRGTIANAPNAAQSAGAEIPESGAMLHAHCDVSSENAKAL